MARWICFGEIALGRVDANDRAGAERLARREFGDRCVRVQSVLSIEAAQAEREEARMRGRREDR